MLDTDCLRKHCAHAEVKDKARALVSAPSLSTSQSTCGAVLYAQG